MTKPCKFKSGACVCCGDKSRLNSRGEKCEGWNEDTETSYTEKRVLEERERCAELCTQHQYEWSYGSTYARAIRGIDTHKSLNVNHDLSSSVKSATSMTRPELSLQIGEMTAQEWRTAQAVMTVMRERMLEVCKKQVV